MSLASVLRHTINVAPVTGTDARGKPSYGAAVPRKARVEVRRALVTKANGEEAVSSHRFWCLEAINLTDRIWLPGENTASPEASHVPLTVSSASDFAGAKTLWKVEL